MKKILIVIICVLIAALITLFFLRRNLAAPAAAPTAEETGVGLSNPVKKSSPEEIAQRFGVEMKAPEGAEELSWTIIEGETPLAQMGYSLDGISFNYRIAKAEAYSDISGMYYEWKENVTAEEGSIRLADGGQGVIDRFDAAKGIVYSLSVNFGASAETLEKAARQLWGEGSDAAVGAPDGLKEQLYEQFDQLRSVCFPGTAGCSLSAAACAAEMADFFFMSGIGPDAVDGITQYYFASLSQEDAQLFEMQLDSVVGAYGSLTGEGGEGLLDDCGYESSCFPWESENVRSCFVALLGAD